MGKHFQRIQPLAAVVLALFAALVVTLGVLQTRVWLHSNTAANPSNETFTDRQKLDILASLSVSSTPGMTDRSKVLHSLSVSATTGPTEEEKLNILEALR